MTLKSEKWTVTGISENTGHPFVDHVRAPTAREAAERARDAREHISPVILNVFHDYLQTEWTGRTGTLMSEEQVVKTEGTICPRCGEDNVDAGAHEHTRGPGTIDQGWWCRSCGWKGELIYKLVGYNSLEGDDGQNNQ